MRIPIGYPLVPILALLSSAPHGEIFAQQTGRKSRMPSAAELQQKYPFVSLESRLEYERKRVQARPERAAPKLSQAAEQNLQAADAWRNPAWANFNKVRSESLRLLHSAQADEFIKRQGFGRSRLPRPSPGELEFSLPPAISFARTNLSREELDHPRIALRQTEAEGSPPAALLPLALGLLRRPAKAETSSATANALRMPSQEVLADHFEENKLNFVGPRSFGYVIDRTRVAGFVPHGFTEFEPWEYPAPASPEEAKTFERDQWAIHALELVSLLKHDSPVTYVSDHLPRMDELHAAPTRPLSAFEEASLPALVAPSRILMLGALRASKTCLDCHYVQRGELLGAFYYDLRRRPVELGARSD